MHLKYAGNGTGHAHGRGAFSTQVRNGLANGIQVHVTVSGQGRFFTVVQTADTPIRLAVDHEAAASQVTRKRIGHGKRHFCGDHGVKSGAAIAQDFAANP